MIFFSIDLVTWPCEVWNGVLNFTLSYAIFQWAINFWIQCHMRNVIFCIKTFVRRIILFTWTLSKKNYTCIQSNILWCHFFMFFFKHLYMYSYVIIWLDSYVSKKIIYYRCIKINLFQILVKKNCIGHALVNIGYELSP